MNQTIITLTNGKRVANFSSPHPFTFVDGTVLPAVSNEDSEMLKVTFTEHLENEKGDISLSFTLSPVVLEEMEKWESLQGRGEVDVVFCPLPMLTAISQTIGDEYLLHSPFRGIRLEDRIKKLASIDKQCLAKGQQ